MKPCTAVNGTCERPIYCRGLCHAHYRRRERGGDITKSVGWKKAQRPKVCAIAGCGRPNARHGLCWGHLKRVQRGQPVAVELGIVRKGTLSDRLAQAALELLAAQPERRSRAKQTLRDVMVASWKKKGTPKGQRGEVHHNAKLSDLDVRAIRLLAADGLPTAIIADRFHVHRTHVLSIVRGATRATT